MPNLVDFTGKTFGRLTISGRAENSRTGKVRWHCLCLCGNTTTVQSTHLQRGTIQSCGCLKGEVTAQRNRKYMHCTSEHYKLYTAFKDMHLRCAGKKASRNYTRNNIRVCPDWHHWDNFATWALANGYQEGLTLDRIDNLGDYEPENCRFITREENARLAWYFNHPEFSLASC